jgi:hypothetical protein
LGCQGSKYTVETHADLEKQVGQRLFKCCRRRRKRRSRR